MDTEISSVTLDPYIRLAWCHNPKHTVQFPDRFLMQICTELEKSPKSLQDKDITVWPLRKLRMHKISNTVSRITQTIINMLFIHV